MSSLNSNVCIEAIRNILRCKNINFPFLLLCIKIHVVMLFETMPKKAHELDMDIYLRKRKIALWNVALVFKAWFYILV